MDISVSFKKKDQESTSASALQKAYETFFRSKLEKYGVSSPAELEGDDISNFFNEISEEWKEQSSNSGD